MSIRIKILIPMIAVAIVISISLGLLCVLSIDSFVSEFNNSQLNEGHRLAQTLLDEHKDGAERAAAASAENEQLIGALEDYRANSDRTRLIEVAKSLMTATDVDFLTVLDNNGDVIVRAHEPDNFGDSLANQKNIQSAMSGKQYTTTETGTAVKLSVRSGAPIFSAGGGQIGVVSLGYRLDQDNFVDYVKRIAELEVTIFLGDTRISTTVLGEDGQRAIGTQASEAVSKKVLGGDDYIGKANVLGKSLYTYYSPIRDTENSILGMLFVGIDTSATDAHKARNTALLLFEVVLFIVLTIIASMIISKKIAKPLLDMSEAAKKLSAGDIDVVLNVSSDTHTKDETVLLGQSFAEVIRANRERAVLIKAVADGDLTGDIQPSSNKDVVGIALKELLHKNNIALGEMSTAAAQLDAAASQIAGGAQELSHNAMEQTATVENLYLMLKDLSGKTTEEAEHATQAATLSESVREFAEKGSLQMDQMIEAVDQISKASESIGKVMKVIDDIAFQTNILALNAAVEAARAGEHGKGFAIVAEEVRNLAAKSAEAAKDTETLIANSIEKAELGAKISTETAASFNEIVGGVKETTGIVEKIANFMQTQNTEIAGITRGIDEINSMVRNINDSAGESASASEEMSSQATLMADTLSRYKLREVD